MSAIFISHTPQLTVVKSEVSELQDLWERLLLTWLNTCDSGHIQGGERGPGRSAVFAVCVYLISSVFITALLGQEEVFIL